MLSVGDRVCAVVGARAVTISDPTQIGYEVGDIGEIHQILPFHEPCHPALKGQKFAIIEFTKKTTWEEFKTQFAFDLRELRKVQI